MVASSNEIFTPCHIQIFILLCSESKRPVVNVNVAAKIAIFSSFQRKFIVKEAAVFSQKLAQVSEYLLLDETIINEIELNSGVPARMSATNALLAGIPKQMRQSVSVRRPVTS